MTAISRLSMSCARSCMTARCRGSPSESIIIASSIRASSNSSALAWSLLASRQQRANDGSSGSRGQQMRRPLRGRAAAAAADGHVLLRRLPFHDPERSFLPDLPLRLDSLGLTEPPEAAAQLRVLRVRRFQHGPRHQGLADAGDRLAPPFLVQARVPPQERLPAWDQPLLSCHLLVVLLAVFAQGGRGL